MWCFDILIVIVCFQNSFNVMISLGTIAISVFCQRVLIVFRFIFMQQIVIYIVVPNLRVFSVFTSQTYCIQNMSRTCIIGGQYEFYSFCGIRNITGEIFVQIFQVRYACIHVAIGLEIIIYFKVFCCFGNDLHETIGSYRGFCLGNKLRFCN